MHRYDRVSAPGRRGIFSEISHRSARRRGRLLASFIVRQHDDAGPAMALGFPCGVEPESQQHFRSISVDGRKTDRTIERLLPTLASARWRLPASIEHGAYATRARKWSSTRGFLRCDCSFQRQLEGTAHPPRPPYRAGGVNALLYLRHSLPSARAFGRVELGKGRFDRLCADVVASFTVCPSYF